MKIVFSPPEGEKKGARCASIGIDEGQPGFAIEECPAAPLLPQATLGSPSSPRIRGARTTPHLIAILFRLGRDPLPETLREAAEHREFEGILAHPRQMHADMRHLGERRLANRKFIRMQINWRALGQHVARLGAFNPDDDAAMALVAH